MTQGHSPSGYTLIELLVVVALTVLLLITATSLFFTTLLGGGKTASLEYTKQAGQHTLEQMSFFIRNARKLQPNYYGQTCSSSMTELVVQSQDLQDVTFTLVEGSIASGSAQMTPPDIVVSDLLFSCTQQDDGSPPSVTVSFVMSQTGLDNKPRDIVTIPFQTTITMRNY